MQNKTGKNISSGAKKVETLEKKTNKTSPSQTVKKAVNAAKTAENAAADRRLELAKAQTHKKEQKYLRKAELKEKKLEKKAELKAKKLEKKTAAAAKKAERKAQRLNHIAQLKAKKAEKKAERLARREILRNETKVEKQKRIEREKKERIALKRKRAEEREHAREARQKEREAVRSRRAEERKHKREQKTERRKHAPGFGGWLAAVVSLGVACLALATVVTAGSLRMNDMLTESVGSARATLFEMVSVSEDMDDNLSKLRASSGSAEQEKLLTDLIVDAAIMEVALERIPVDTVTGTDISAFVNKTGTYCRNLLSSLMAGNPLTETERNTLNYLYEINSKLYRELNELATHMTEKEFRAFLGGEAGSVAEKFGEIGQGTLKEPQDTVEAPFAKEGNVGTNMLEKEAEITRARAEELVKKYFEGYHIASVSCTGETVARSVQCYNFVLTDVNGIELYAEITKKGGKLAFFDTYETCTEKNFDLERCDGIAKDFLKDLGIENVEAVWRSDAGMVADLTYVRIQKGVRVYPELIRVRVCESKGRVVGMDAMNYYMNCEERSFERAMPYEEAATKLAKELKPYAVHLALISQSGKEILCNEFACTLGEDEYIVYLNAVTGEEVQVYRVRNSKGGSYLR